MAFSVSLMVSPAVPDGDGLVFVPFVIGVIIFSFLFLGFSFYFGHGIPEITNKLLVVPVETFVVEITFRIVFTDFVKVVHV